MEIFLAYLSGLHYCLLFLVVHPDSDDNLSPGEFSPRTPVHSTAKKGRARPRASQEPAAGFARAYDLGKNNSAMIVDRFLQVFKVKLTGERLFRVYGSEEVAPLPLP